MSDRANSSKTVYVISGASRGIGYGVVEQLAKRSGAIVYAGARDVSKADKLQQLAQQHSNIHVVQLRADSEEDHKAVAAKVEKEAGRVDVLWANAGICVYDEWNPVHKASVPSLREHIEVNTIHPLLMYQAFYALLRHSSSPKFFVSSSISGSTGLLEKISCWPQLLYAMSKAAVNNMTRRIHFEDDKLTAVPFHPGPPSTHSRTQLAKNTLQTTHWLLSSVRSATCECAVHRLGAD